MTLSKRIFAISFLSLSTLASAQAGQARVGVQCEQTNAPFSELFIQGAKFGGVVRITFRAEGSNLTALKNLGVAVTPEDEVQVAITSGKTDTISQNDASQPLNVSYALASDASLKVIHVNAARSKSIPLVIAAGETYVRDNEVSFFVDLVTNVNSMQTISLNFAKSECKVLN